MPRLIGHHILFWNLRPGFKSRGQNINYVLLLQDFTILLYLLRQVAEERNDLADDQNVIYVGIIRASTSSTHVHT
jgi:hypothetical protein